MREPIRADAVTSNAIQVWLHAMSSALKVMLDSLKTQTTVVNIIRKRGFRGSDWTRGDTLSATTLQSGTECSISLPRMSGSMPRRGNPPGQIAYRLPAWRCSYEALASCLASCLGPVRQVQLSYHSVRQVQTRMYKLAGTAGLQSLQRQTSPRVYMQSPMPPP